MVTCNTGCDSCIHADVCSKMLRPIDMTQEIENNICGSTAGDINIIVSCTNYLRKKDFIPVYRDSEPIRVDRNSEEVKSAFLKPAKTYDI